MLYLILHSVSTNPNYGPEVFGLLCDIGIAIVILFSLYQTWKARH